MEENKEEYNDDNEIQGDFESVNPFQRRESVQRTPPRMRAYSVPDVETSVTSDLTDGQQETQTEDPSFEMSQKRKRDEWSPEVATQKKKTYQKGKTVGETQVYLDGILKEIKKLDLTIRFMYKPKQEIKDISTKLSLLAAKIRSAETQVVEHSDPATTLEQELLIENERLRKEMKNLKEKSTTTTLPPESTALCPQCTLVREKKFKRQALKTEENFENFLSIAEQDWGSEVFPKAVVINKPIWEAPFEEELILPCSGKFTTNDRMVGIAIKKFGGQEGLIKQNKTKGEAALMTHTIGFPDSMGHITQDTRRIYYPIISDGECWETVEDKVLFNALNMLKTQIVDNHSRKIAIPEMGGIAGTMFMRMIEYLFADTGIKLKMYTLMKVNNKQTLPLASLPQPVKSKTPKAKTNALPVDTRRKRYDAVIVQAKDKSYADLLKTVKQTVNPAEIGVNVKDVSRTKNGDLLLKVGNGSAKAEELREQIMKAIPNAKTTLSLDKVIIHIKGMDDVTTENEIRTAISQAISVDEGSFRLSSLRPAFGGKRNVTVIMSEKNAETLIKMSTIKIGWTHCRVLERKNDTRCFRCWEIGHQKQHCTGPDRGNLCKKCGKEGHKASNCPNEPYCVHCKVTGHQSGSLKCKKSLQELRENSGQHQKATNQAQ